MKKIISMVLIVTLTLSLFTIGASANSNCNHDETYEYFAAGNVKETEDGKCYRQGYFIKMCALCESEVSEPYMKTEIGEHNFESGRCTKCFTEATVEIEPVMNKECMHSSAYTQEGYSNIYPDGDLCITDTYTTDYCPECGYVTDEEKTTQKNTHVFKNSYCINCSVSQQETCEHTFEPYPLATSASCNEDGKCVIRGYFELRCVKCEQKKGNEYSDTVIKDHNYNSEGICTNCYYNGKNSFSSEITKIGYVVGTDNLGLRLRKGASTATAKITTIPEGASVEVIEGEKINGFYKVRWNGIGGFVHSDYISFTTKPVSEPTTAKSSYILPFNGIGRVTVLEYYWGKASAGRHPCKGAGNIRGAVDFAVTGSALATASGTVVEAKTGYNSGWGSYIIIRHSDGTYSFYSHLSKISVSVNQKINQGQTIGTIGSTGNSTGLHLHFEIWDSAKRTIYTIDALKPHKERLRFDSDVVSGGSNSSAIRNWITSNYTLSGGVYIPKPNSTSASNISTTTSKPVATQQVAPTQTTTQVSKKANFVKSQISAWQSLLESKKQAAENCISVCNEVNAKLSIQQALGVSISAVTTLQPTKLFAAVDEDVALYTLAAVLNNEYKRKADSNYYAFLENRNKITNDSEAASVYTFFVEALASYDYILKGTYDTVSQFAAGGEYTKRMADKFVLGLVEGYVESDVVKLKKAADTVQNMSSLLETVKNQSVGLKQYKDTKKQWAAIWEKV